jgi:type II secretory pathway component PulJ
MDPKKERGKGIFGENAQGLTLIEVIIASMFFSLLSLALFAAISSASNILQMQTLNAGINQGGMQLIRSISREIAESSPVADQSHLIITTDASANNVVTFQVPVDWDNDGDVVQDALSPVVEWGAYRFVREPQQQSWLNYWVRYRVVNNQLLREILPSSNGEVLATDVIVPDSVLAFTVTLNNRRAVILLTIRKTDTVGQKGANARTYQTTFDGDVLLRNGG